MDLSGDGRERGEAHGEALRPAIATALDRWRERVGSRHEMSAEDFVAAFLDSTGYVQAVERLTPDLAAEVAGIAAASGQSVADIWAYNLMDEEWRYEHGHGVGCSLLAVQLDPERLVIGQNMDLPASMAGSQAVLRIAPRGDEPAQIVLTAAGMIGLFGVNRAGVAVCVNTLEQLTANLAGLPVAFVVREILRQRSADLAVARLTSVPHASGQHYAIAEAGSVRGFECSPEGCVESPRASRLIHTNHVLWADAHRGSGGPEVWGGPTTVIRYEALEKVVSTIEQPGDIRRVLSDPSSVLCVRPSSAVRTETFCSAEFVLGDEPVVQLATGRPDVAAWRELGWANRSLL